MRLYDWSSEKNTILQDTRGVCFEDVVAILESNEHVAIISSLNPVRYPNQKAFVLKINGYIHLVPFVEEGDTMFFTTIIPSRKANKLFN